MAVFPDNAAISTVDVVLAAGPDLEGAVTAVVTGLGGTPDVAEGDLVIVCAGRSELERRAAQTVSDLDTARTGRRALIAAPSGLFPGTTRWSARRLAGCVAVDLGNRGERINHVLVRRDVAGAGTLVAVAALRLDRAGRPPLALGLWPGFVHPRLALAARLGGERVPLVAEIALAFAPRVLVLVGQTRSRALAVATTDRIAADLVGLALRAEYADTDADRLGPWEDPLVQRTTELGLGVRLPRQINLRVVWTDRANDAGALETSSLAARLRLALGIPNAPPRSRSG
jgi:hypothetical protein